jgi:hypothetical protein
MEQSYLMSRSTIIMPCNYSGFTDPASTAGFSIVDFDWSNSKAQWVKSKPMNDEELLMEQVEMTAAATQGTTVWVYRNSIYSYPWYTSARTILEDPAYEAWHLKFKEEGPWTSPKCDNNYHPPLCSDYFHSQEQSPGYPTGDGNCSAPACDCGSVPCGMYLWNHSSDAVVNGQTFQDWFIDSYMFNEVGMSDLVSGFFWDDLWTATEIFSPDLWPNTTQDMGLTQDDLDQLTASYNLNMAALKARTLAEGKFSWQMLWSGPVDQPDNYGGTCPKPLVQEETCAINLRSLCREESPQYEDRALMYSFGPGGCSGADPSQLPELDQDLANFLLVRGPYAWLGHGWLGCSLEYAYPEELEVDYGEPLGLCTESKVRPGVFTREWTKATVQMDCNTWTPTIDLK